jgi:hypothetical protein
MTVWSWPIVSLLEIETPLDAIRLQPCGLCSYGESRYIKTWIGPEMQEIRKIVGLIAFTWQAV